MATTILAASATHTIEAIERGIELNEGPYLVEGRFYPHADDAARQRRWYAERLLRRLTGGITEEHRQRCLEVKRLTAAGETSCAWCGQGFGEEVGVVPLGGKLLHDTCAAEYDVFTTDEAPRYELTPAGRAALAGED